MTGKLPSERFVGFLSERIKQAENMGEWYTALELASIRGYVKGLFNMEDE